MDSLPNDDELLLMELERRDGIYSFIFHELEANKFQTNKPENQHKNNIHENHKKWQPKCEEVPTTSTAKSPLLSATSTFLTTSNSSKPYSYASCFIKNSTIDLDKTWPHSQSKTPVNLNFQFQMPFSAAAYPSFQQLCSLRTLHVRGAKPSFSHIQTPLVRNRRHELKETPEYKNFMNSFTKVADLRELFPLDPDVHAPFAELRDNARTISKSSGLMVKATKFLK
ncbi:uncharacterized protein LOC135956885 [Calliphora vicina]|uniref:uncharacterized protein LOC135956885 n=1 Tax=Calliphora vicina TaxID=7373 RepID=UPI00325B7EB8